jgi:hypothetical protein
VAELERLVELNKRSHKETHSGVSPLILGAIVYHLAQLKGLAEPTGSGHSQAAPQLEQVDKEPVD